MNKKRYIEGLGKAVPFLMIIPLILFFGLMVAIMIDDLAIHNECDKLDECESYKCIQEKGITLNQQNNAALKYQNCLLEEKIGGADGERPQFN